MIFSNEDAISFTSNTRIPLEYPFENLLLDTAIYLFGMFNFGILI